MTFPILALTKRSPYTIAFVLIAGVTYLVLLNVVSKIEEPIVNFIVKAMHVTERTAAKILLAIIYVVTGLIGLLGTLGVRACIELLC